MTNLSRGIFVAADITFAPANKAGLSKEKPIKECLDLANKVAGISTTKLGAGDAMPFLKDIN